MIKIAICDDESFLLEKNKEIAESALKDLGCDYEIDAMSSGTELLDRYNSGKRYDILLLDYQMDDLTGVETAEGIRRIDKNVMIIFISSYLEPATEGYTVGAFRYVYRSQTGMEEKIKKAIQTAVTTIRIDTHIYTIKTKSRDYHLQTKDIYFLESHHHTVTAHTADGMIDFRKPLDEIANELEEWGFIRIHKSYIVNARHIKSIRKNHIIIAESKDIELPISKKLYTDIIDAQMSLYDQTW